MLTVLLLFTPCLSMAEEEDMSAAGFDNQRIEQEEKLYVPLDKAEEVWNFLYQQYVVDVSHLRSLDSLLTSYSDQEQFTDVYYDTPTLQMYGMQSGVRHRKRVNLTNPNDRKSGRELMQIKLNHITSNKLERGEIKYAIEYPTQLNDRLDRHPMLGIIKKSHRPLFMARLAGIGVDAVSMRQVLTVHDLRTRVYMLRDNKPFISISFDRVHSNIWWANADFVEIEPELNEIAFTDADPQMRKYMESVLAKIVTEVREKFPYVQSNLTPKYNKSFDQMHAQLPFLRLLVRANLLSAEAMWATILAAGLCMLGAAFGVSRRVKRSGLGFPSLKIPHWSRTR